MCCTGGLSESRALLPNAFHGKLNQVRAKQLSSAAKGANLPVGSSTRFEAQPQRNFDLCCGQDVLDCLLRGFFWVKIDWYAVRCLLYEPPRFQCNKCRRMGPAIPSVSQCADAPLNRLFASSGPSKCMPLENPFWGT